MNFKRLRVFIAPKFRRGVVGVNSVHAASSTDSLVDNTTQKSKTEAQKSVTSSVREQTKHKGQMKP